MTREEQIKKQADNYIGHPQDVGEDISITNTRNAFIEGAKWADRTLIEKTCRWLINIDFDGYDFRDCDESFNNDLLVDAFRRKVMEE